MAPFKNENHTFLFQVLFYGVGGESTVPVISN